MNCADVLKIEHTRHARSSARLFPVRGGILSLELW